MTTRYRAWTAGLHAAACLALTAPALVAQEAVPTWDLRGPLIEIGQGDVDFHRVRGAASLPDGRIAVADQGNARVLIFEADGELLRTIGREGDGPGEFRYLTGVHAFGDTLVVGQPSRVSVWLMDGTLLEDRSIPTHGGTLLEALVALSPQDYVARTRAPSPDQSPGLHEQPQDLIVVDLGTGETGYLDTYLWERVYMHVATSGPTPGARTAYAAPFLGRAHVTTSNGSVVVLPTDSVSLHVIDRDGRHTQHIDLPVERRPFRSNPAIAHRDSVLAGMSDQARSLFPFAENNIRETYRSDFPVPEHAPAFQRMVAVGAEQVWLEAFRHPGDDVTSWYVVDLPQERVVGRIDLPHERVVLGGAGTRVFVLERDAFDVEVLRVYEVVR